jgi:competence protein ComEC
MLWLSGFNVAVIALPCRICYHLSSAEMAEYLKQQLLSRLSGFAFVNGLSPSVTRAAVMIMLVMIGALIQRRVNTMNILLASAYNSCHITCINCRYQLSAVFTAVLA